MVPIQDPTSEIGQLGARPNRRRWILGTAIVLVLVVGSWLLINRLAASGDPGGRVIDQLTPAVSVLPGYGTSDLPWTSRPSESKSFLIKSEPKKDSCDGRAGTGGWSDVVVQGFFQWSGSHGGLISKVGTRLNALGWHQTVILDNTDEAIWKKMLNNGSKATAMLSLSPLGDPRWEFNVQAPPVGTPATGC
jgi:hypothetical protein